MSRLDEVIRETEEVQKRKNGAWIFDDNGNIKDEVIALDTLQFLKEIKEAGLEINVSDEWVKNFKKDAHNFYSYNYGAACSHDISIWYKENCPVGLVCIHLSGDAASGWFSDFFAVKSSDTYSSTIFEALNNLYWDNPQTIDLGDRYSITMGFFTETYDVWDYIDQREVGSYFGIEKADVLEEIERSA